MFVQQRMKGSRSMISFDPRKEKYMSLATFRKSGKEVRTPVWVAENNETLYVFSEGTAGKVKRIRNNGRAQIAACNFNGEEIKSDWTIGTARLVEDQSEIDAMYRAFAKKYGLVMTLTNLLSRISGRYTRRAIIAIDVSKS
jgi:PPOX class probable F420-dependent enzyme